MLPLPSTLVFGNPLFDRTCFVQDRFLDAQGLKKGSVSIATSRSALDAVWSARAQAETIDEWTVGGSGTNVAKVMANLGESNISLYGMIGNDERGNQIRGRLKAIGIKDLLSLSDKETGLVNCFVTPDSERTMQVYPSAAFDFSQDYVQVAHFKNVKHLHLEGYIAYYGTALQSSIKCARENDASISIDLASVSIVNDFKPALEDCLPYAKYIFANKEEITAYTGEKTAQEALMNFDAEQTVVATVGSDGCYVKAAGESDAIHYTAVKVAKVIDTTGAGDFLDAAFLRAALVDRPTKTCAQMGNLAASYVIQQLGADLPKDKWIELRGALAKV